MELPQTSTPRPGETPQIASRFTPYERFASEHRKKLLWMGVAFGSFVFNVLALMHVVDSMQVTKFAFACDGAGSIYFAPLGRVDSGSQVVQTEAMQAVIASLTRSPVGLDYPEFIDKLFRRDVADRLKEEVEKEKPYLASRSMRIKPEITSIRALGAKNNLMRLVQVDGQLILAGQVSGVAISDVESFKMLIALIPNANLRDKGATPFIVSDYRLKRDKVEAPSTTKEQNP